MNLNILSHARLVALLLATTPFVVAQQEAREIDASRTAEDHQRKKDERRCRSALDAIQLASDSKSMARELTVLRAGLPGNRALLVEAFRRGTTRVRTIVLQLLASPAAGKVDEGVIREGLRDPTQLVRSIAIQGVQGLGDSGVPLLVDYYLSETEARNRLMALKALVAHHRSEELVPDLVRMLTREKDVVVRRACIRALETLSGKKFGDDFPAWKEHVRDIAALQRIRKEILHKDQRK